MSDLDRFPKPAATVDLVLMTMRDARLTVLLQQRAADPFVGQWALPGGFVRVEEGLDEAAERILTEKARMQGAWIEQLYTFGAPGRDPRGRVITVAYFALLPRARFDAAMEATDDLALAALEVPWQGETGGPIKAVSASGEALSLAFDHGDILALAVKRLRGKLDYTEIGFALLSDRFTLRELQDVHEAILGRSLNKPAFRRRMLERGWLDSTGKRETGTGFRPAELYRLKSRKG